jgi:hypothetical protein
MIKTIFLLLTYFLILLNGKIYSQISELPLTEKVKQASDIFEGKIILKTSYWNNQHTLIYTSNITEIYKIFKGDIKTLKVELITDGGQVDNEIQKSKSNLELNENAIGLFFAVPFKNELPQNIDNKTPKFIIYGNSQGFIKYDLVSNSAADPFNKYNNIHKNLYKIIEKITTHPYTEVKEFSSIQPSKKKAKKIGCKINKKKK